MSEREKILEYANRHWQTRLEHNLPVGTGRAPYGWQWKDKDKTKYVINKEEAAVRFSIFEMFVEMDMSLRGIAHKLTEDGILPPAKSRGANVKSAAWRPSTVHMLLTDVANIGILRICKSTKVMTAKGTHTTRPNANMKTIPSGLPAIVSTELYELAKLKLQANKSDKSHVHRNPEDFLLKGHIFCKTCHYRMLGRYRTSQKLHIYPYYACTNQNNKYDACPDLMLVRTDNVDKIVWDDCCCVFENLNLIRDTIERSIEQELQNMLEDTKGTVLVVQLTEEIAYAKQERAKHPEGSYYHKLISQDIREKEEQLARYEEEYRESRDVVKLSQVYQKSILSFFNFLTTMKGKYHEATFKEKRNALDVLGVKVYIHPVTQEAPTITAIETEQEWLSVGKAAKLTGIPESTLRHRIKMGDLKEHRIGVPSLVVHRDGLAKFLQTRRRKVDLEQHRGEWFTVHKLETSKITTYRAIHKAIQLGEVQAQTMDIVHRFIHRDELNRLLQELPVRPRTTWETLQPRVEITYTPMFTGVQSSFG